MGMSTRQIRRSLTGRPGCRPHGFPVPLDILVHTGAKLEQMLADGSQFVKGALENGQTLVER
jgi:hypothetical protein